MASRTRRWLSWPTLLRLAITRPGGTRFTGIRSGCRCTRTLVFTPSLPPSRAMSPLSASNSILCDSAARSRTAGIRLLRAELFLTTLLLAGASCWADPYLESLAKIVVTARKIPEPLANVPLSIQVITRQELQRAGVDGLQSLAAIVPGLYVEPMWGGTNAAPTLRGQSHPGPGGNTVGVFVDGVLQANVAGDDAAMFDLERVEVVKGPQSALYGDSTFAGAINFVTRRPTADLQSEVNVSAGTDAYRTIAASVSGPLSLPDLLARVSISAREFGGTATNLADPHNNLGGYERWGASASLEYSWPNAWGVISDLRLTNDRDGQPATSTLFASGYNCGSQDPKTGYWSFYCGDIPRTRQYSLSPDIPDSSTGRCRRRYASSGRASVSASTVSRRITVVGRTSSVILTALPLAS